MSRALLAVGVLVTLTACAADARSDLPVDKQSVKSPSVEVYRMPDGFPNITSVCMNGDRVYATTRDYNSITVIVDGCDE